MSETITKKIALYRSVGEYDFETLGEEYMDANDGYVRVSEYVEHSFKMLDPSVYVGKQIEVLNKMKETVREESAKKMASIEDRIGKLTAITDQSGDLPDLDAEGIAAQDAQAEESDRV